VRESNGERADMTIFDTAVDTYGILYRVYMRLHGYFRPIREAQTFFGAKLTCNIRDFIQRRIYFFKIYEPNLTYLFINTIRAGDVVVDIGANIGYFSLLASQLVGSAGKVIAVEAAPETFNLLRRNIERNACRNIQLVNVAATLEETSVVIVRSQAHNSGAHEIRISSALGQSDVPGRPVSALVGNDLSRVHFIKIDIEGSEAPVLEDILKHVGELPQRLTIVAEISDDSAKYVEVFHNVGFHTAGLPNNYSIGYFLVRHYLRRSEEDAFTLTRPVNEYTRKYRDYVFIRG
jgi:FkbM family methyltransferase